MEDIRKRDHNLLLLPEGRNISQNCKSYFNREKSNNRVLPSTYFTKPPQFDSGAPALAVTDSAGRGRAAGKAALASGGNAHSARAVPPSAQELRLQPGFPQHSLPRYRTQAHGATGNQTLGLPASSHGHRARSPSGLEPPRQRGTRQPRSSPPRPGPARSRTRRLSPGQLRRPVLPAPCPEEEKLPRTHGPRLPRALLSAPLAAAAVANRALPLPGRPGPAGTWSSGRGCALPAERGPAAAGGSCAGLLRSGRTAKAAP